MAQSPSRDRITAQMVIRVPLALREKLDHMAATHEFQPKTSAYTRRILELAVEKWEEDNGEIPISRQAARPPATRKPGPAKGTPRPVGAAKPGPKTGKTKRAAKVAA